MKCYRCEELRRTCERCLDEQTKRAALTPRWQTLTDDGFEKTQQLRTSGGWLFRTIVYSASAPSPCVALAFQPDPQEKGSGW